MIPNKIVKKVLCFGDSLTWGDSHDYIRFDLSDRWTFILQERLGNDFDIIEEGLCGRTTDMNDSRNPDRNGFEYFRPCFESHQTPDILIYMLGSNDVKKQYNKDAFAIFSSIIETMEWMEDYNRDTGGMTRVIIMAPPLINIGHLKSINNFNEESNEKLTTLANHLSNYTKEKRYDFLDLSKIMKGAERDGIHLSIEDNKVIAEKLAGIILSRK